MADMIFPGTATPAQVLSGQTFSAGTNFNATGTMPNNGAVTITPGTAAQTIAAGYHNGSGTVVGDADLVASNIVSGVNIFGVAGSAAISQYATGSAVSSASTSTFTTEGSTGSTGTCSTYVLTVLGLSFKPKVILVEDTSGHCVAYGQDSYFNGGSGANQANIRYSTHALTTSGYASTGSIYNIKTDGTTAYVNSTGFQLPVPGASASFTWRAYG